MIRAVKQAIYRRRCRRRALHLLDELMLVSCVRTNDNGVLGFSGDISDNCHAYAAVHPSGAIMVRVGELATETSTLLATSSGRTVVDPKWLERSRA